MALAAVAAAEYGYGKQTVDWSHVPYYNVDWASQGEGKGYGYGGDSYGELLTYGQHETRSKDDTKTNWWTDLPGKSHIKRDDNVHAEMRVGYSHGGYGGDYKKDNYKMDNYKKY